MAGEPNSGDIKITPAFLRTFQVELEKMLGELEGNHGIAELALTKGGVSGENRRLLPGNEMWLAAKQLGDKYQGASGTAPTLYAQIESMRTYIKDLNDNINEVVRIAETGEEEALSMTTELNTNQLSEIFRPTTGAGTGGNGTGGNGTGGNGTGGNGTGGNGGSGTGGS
ncbi:hypothetical protein [Nocardia sp. NRRL S-836]|uniref:hypothetical protein n=1 Tax=Nocardia sp. NRRL S-836 TaxID=1519492 RepID=UPI0007C661A1|nr:hypothetical protein [Nocardia sp. NRRL S-836]